MSSRDPLSLALRSEAMSVSDAALDAIAVVATSDRFPGVDLTGTTDSTAALQAAVDATPDGSVMLIPAGTYLVAGPIAPKSGKSITISGYGAKIVATTSKSAFSLRGEYGATVSIAAVEERTIAYPSGVSALTSVLVTSGAPDWQAGDVLKLVADDLIPEARPGGRRIGEFVVVDAVEGGSTRLSGRVREVYQTNIRAARVSTQTMTIVGVTLETAADRMSAVNEALISFSRLTSPQVIDVHCTRSGGQVVRFSSCFGYLAKDIRVDYARDDNAAGAYGYGVLDNSCSFGLVVGGLFRHVRHAYTDDTQVSDPGSADLAPYGRTYGTIVANVQVLMGTAAGFSTHHASESVTFSACSVTGGIPQGGASVGYELRGKENRVIGCVATQLTDGVLVRTESVGGESRGHMISDFRADRLSGAAVRFEIHPGGHPAQNARDGEVNAWIEGLRAVRSMRLIFVENAVVAIQDAFYMAPAGSAGQSVEAIFARNSEIRARDIVLDYTTNTAGLPRPFITGGSSGRSPGGQVTELTNFEVRISVEAAARAYFAFGGAENLILARDLRFSNPFQSMPGQSHPDTNWQWRVDPRPGVPRSDLSSAYYFYKSTDLKNVLPEVMKSADDRVTIDINAENKKITVLNIPPGRRRGQEWVFVQSTGGETTFVHGTEAGTSLKSSLNRVLWKGRRLELTWDGSLWREFVSLSIT